jgi:hypothetical protein
MSRYRPPNYCNASHNPRIISNCKSKFVSNFNRLVVPVQSSDKFVCFAKMRRYDIKSHVGTTCG